MVDAVVPQAQLELSEAPRTQIDASVFLRAPRLAEGLQQLGAGAEDLTDSLAKQQAQTDLQQQRVTLGPDGSVQVANPANSVILGRAGQDYNVAVQQGTVAAARSQVTQQLADAHASNLLDAQGFAKAAQPIVEGLRNSPNLNPRVANALADEASSQAAQHVDNIVERTTTVDTSNAKQAILTNISDTQSKLSAMARQGATGTDDYMLGQAQLYDSYQALAANKLYGYSPEKAQSEFETALDGLKADYVVGQVDATFTRKGRGEAQRVLEDGILNNPDLHLDDAERKQAYSWGMARLQYLTGEQKAQVDANRIAVDSTIEAIHKDPNAIPDALYGQVLNQTRSLGDAEGAAKLEAARAVSRTTRPMTGLTDEQRFNTMMSEGAGGSEAAALQFFQSKGWSPAQAAGIVGNLVTESGLKTGAVNPGDGSDGSDSVGMGQWNGPRAAALKAFAAAQGRAPTDFQTQLAFVQHELETSEGGAAQMLRGAATPRDAAAAFALGYERPQGFLSGNIAQVSLGSQRVAAAERIAGGGASSQPIAASAGSLPFAPAAVKANPFLMSEYVRSIAADQGNVERLGKSIGEGLETQIKAGNAPDAMTLANFFQVATRQPDTFGEQAQRVESLLSGGALADAAGQASPAAGQALVDQAKTIADQSPSIFHTQVAQAAQAAYTRQAAALKEDPFEEAQRRGWLARPPAPLDLSPPQDGQPSTVPQAVADRGRAAALVASRTGIADTPAFSPKDLPQVKAMMTSGTLDQRVGLLGAIANSGMPQPVMQATLRQLGETKETLPLAVAGSLVKDNPQAARDILQGQALMQTEPKLAPNKDDFPAEMAKAIPFNDLPSADARRGIDGAVQAYYAKLSADAGDTTGILNADRVQRAVDAVTGGTFAYRGSRAIAPWYGASQADADAALRTLSDADLAGARTTDGQPFPAAALKPSFSGAFTWNNWRLQSTGDGKYLVFSGPDDKRQYLGNAQGGKFVLDLGAKREAASRLGMSLVDSVAAPLAAGAYYGGGN